MTSRVTGELKDIIVDATRALARLDADRLEEIAMSCRVLNHALPQADAEGIRELQRAAAATKHEMPAFARVLEMTQTSLGVLKRGREARAIRLAYGHGADSSRTDAERRYGDN